MHKPASILSALSFALALAAGGIAHAETATFNCSAGGTISATYTWNPLTGSITYNATSTDCSFGAGAVTGSVMGNGTFKPTTATVYDVDLTATKNFSVGGPRDFSGSYVCTVTAKGTFNVTAQTFTGTITKNNCVATGTLSNTGNLVYFLLNFGD